MNFIISLASLFIITMGSVVIAKDFYKDQKTAQISERFPLSSVINYGDIHGTVTAIDGQRNRIQIGLPNGNSIWVSVPTQSEG